MTYSAPLIRRRSMTALAMRALVVREAVAADLEVCGWRTSSRTSATYSVMMYSAASLAVAAEGKAGGDREREALTSV